MKKEKITIVIDEKLADELNGKCFLDLDMSDRLEGFRFAKTSTGIDVLYVGCDYHWGYAHNFHDNYGTYDVEDTYNGYDILNVQSEHFLIREITPEKFDELNKIVNDQMEKQQQLEREFGKLQARFGFKNKYSEEL